MLYFKERKFLNIVNVKLLGKLPEDFIYKGSTNLTLWAIRLDQTLVLARDGFKYGFLFASFLIRVRVMSRQLRNFSLAENICQVKMKFWDSRFLICSLTRAREKAVKIIVMNNTLDNRVLQSHK